MHEIVTLQFGQQSNYLGTHFWNTQVRVWLRLRSHTSLKGLSPILPHAVACRNQSLCFHSTLTRFPNQEARSDLSSPTHQKLTRLAGVLFYLWVRTGVAREPRHSFPRWHSPRWI